MSVEEKLGAPEGYPYALIDDKTGEVVAWFSDREAASGVESWAAVYDLMGIEIERLKRLVRELGGDPEAKPPLLDG